MSRPHNKTSKRRNDRRRGSAYLLVLGIAMLVTILGMGTLLATRASTRTVSAGVDWEESGTLAIAATEHAVSYLNAMAAASPTTWRSAYTSGQTAYTQAMGRGTFSWTLDDASGNLSANYAAPIRIFGTGKVGNVTRYYSVEVTPGPTPLAVLGTAVYAGGSITMSGGSEIIGGTVASNSTVNTSSASAVNATIQSNTTMPTPSAADYSMYAGMATAIPVTTGSNNLQPLLLTPYNNPYGATDPNGLYSITLQPGANLQISSSRIVGTLVISASNANITFAGPMLWEAARPGYPILIISATNSTITFQGSTSWLKESTVNANLNPAATPFEGVSDTNSTDDFPPQYRGLIHIIGSSNSVQLSSNSYFFGTIVTDGTIAISNQCTVIQDPTIYANPPAGYASGSQLTIVPGSWKWDGPP